MPRWRSIIAYAVSMGKLRAVSLGRSPAPLLASYVALLAAPALALATPGDVVATQRYVQANYALVQAGNAKLRTVEGVFLNLKAKLGGECASVAANSPQNEDSTQLTNEVIGAVVLSAYDTDQPAGARFTRTVEGLRWSSRKLTSVLQSYATKLKVLNTLAVPNVCADVRAWIASGYQTLPASTVRFDQQFVPNWVAIGELPSGLLAPYERPSQRAVLRRTAQLESKLTEFEAEDGVNTWGDIMDTLVLSP
jgi:hypothetical protein